MGWLVLVTVCVGVCGAVEVLAYGLQQSGEVAMHVAGQAALHQWHCPAAAGGDVVYTVLDQAATWVLAHGVDAAIPPMALYRQRVAFLVHLGRGGVGRGAGACGAHAGCEVVGPPRCPADAPP